MAVGNSPLDSIIARAAATQASAKATLATQQTSSGSGGSTDSFGPATNVTLSAEAQAIVSSGQSSASVASAGSPPSGGSVPVSTGSNSTSTDRELLIEEAERQVIPKVGVTGASEVVDDKGNIDEVKLNALIAQQNQSKPNPLFDQTA